LMASLNATLHRPATAPSLVNPELTPDLDALILRMLAKDPAQRPSIDAVVEALLPVAGERSGAPSSSARTGSSSSRARIDESSVRASVRAPEPQRAPTWSRLRFALAAALLVLLIGFGARRAFAPPKPLHRSAPSIAVLPFATVGDEANAYFSAGVSEDITSMLARAPEISVLSCSAALAYKDKPADARRIGSELGVAYVLEGTVRKEAGKVRIVAQLIDTRSGTDVWSERFDRTGADPWLLQDEVAGKIVVALTGEYGQVKRAQYREAWGTDSTSLDEYDHYLRGHEHYMRFTAADNERAGALWRAGLVTFPDSALLQAKLGWYHFMRPYLYFIDGAATDYARSGELVRSALATPHLSPLASRVAHWLFAYVSAREGEYDRALREMETTRALAPYDAFQKADLATILILAGKPDEAVTSLDQVIADDAANRAFYQQLKGWALTVAGRHAESITALGESIDLTAVPLLQAINHARLGRPEVARAEVAKALKLQPDMTLAKWRSANFYRDPAVLDAQLADLAAAGLR
ncbi:MAG: hypothetical protein ACMG6S_20620, partial [Byssovorax sp.]